MKRTIVLVLVLLTPLLTYADSICQVEDYLVDHSVLPLMGHTPWELADNLLDAQRLADLHQKDSLLLSENAVERAITMEAENPWDYRYCDDSNCVIMWAQSRVAINDQAHISVWPPSINFPPTPITTPEPSSLFMLGVSLVGLGFFAKRYRRAFTVNE